MQLEGDIDRALHVGFLNNTGHPLLALEHFIGKIIDPGKNQRKHPERAQNGTVGQS